MNIMKSSKPIPRMWIWTFLLVLPGVASGLRLLNVSGPSVVVNGSTPLLVLDCEYEISERDKHGLVVKWYFNRNAFPAYQWIPNHLPQDLGVLKGRIDYDYHVSEDPFMKHRALAIRNPTVELSGEYTCWISSFESEAMARKNVIIYSPADEMTFTWTKPTDLSVLVLCKAIGVHPEPHMAIFRSDDPTHRNLIENADVKVSEDETGYSVSVQLELFDYELEDETVFKCVLKVPGTEYQEQEQILYYPGGAPTTTTTTTTSTTTTSTSTAAAFAAATDDKNNKLSPTASYAAAKEHKNSIPSTTSAFLATKDNKNNVDEVKDYSMGNDLPEHMSNSIVQKEDDINMDLASKAESVTAEESPRVAESVSGGKNNSWSLVLLCSLILLQYLLQ